MWLMRSTLAAGSRMTVYLPGSMARVSRDLSRLLRGDLTDGPGVHQGGVVVVSHAVAGAFGIFGANRHGEIDAPTI